VNVKKNYVWRGVSRAIIQISTSDLVALFTHLLDIKLITQIIKTIIYSALQGKIQNCPTSIISYKSLNISMQKLKGYTKYTTAVVNALFLEL
jgi:hypothetical protein